eukprot:g3670.t1
MSLKLKAAQRSPLRVTGKKPEPFPEIPGNARKSAYVISSINRAAAVNVTKTRIRRRSQRLRSTKNFLTDSVQTDLQLGSKQNLHIVSEAFHNKKLKSRHVGAEGLKVMDAEQFLSKAQMCSVLKVKLKKQTDYCHQLEEQISDKDRVINRIHAQNRALQQQLRTVTQAAASLAAGSGAVSSALLASKNTQITRLMKRVAALESALDQNVGIADMTDEEAGAAARVLLEQAMKRCPNSQPEVRNELSKALNMTKAPEEKTQWIIDPSGSRGMSCWLHIFSFLVRDGRSLCAVTETCQGFISILNLDDTVAPTLWQEELSEQASEIFGPEAVEEVLENAKLEAEKEGSNWRDICRRMAQSSFLGLPTSVDGTPCRTIIIDVGAEEVRVGADIRDLRTPVVVSTRDADGNLTGPMGRVAAIKKGLRQLMGSERYVEDSGLLLIEGCGLDWRSGPQSKSIAKAIFQEIRPRALKLASAQEKAVAILAVFGGQTGITIDMGAKFTHIEPVMDLQPVHFAHEFTPMGGHYVTEYFSKMLKNKGFALSDKVLEQIKAEALLCAIDASPAARSKISPITVSISGGIEVELSAEERCAPVEVLFDPCLAGRDVDGLADVLYKVIRASPMDGRRDLCGKICLVGGGAAIPGLAKRLKAELLMRLTAKVDVNVLTPVADTAVGDTRALFQWCAYLGTHLMMQGEREDLIQQGEDPEDLDVFLEDFTSLDLFDADPDRAITKSVTETGWQ